MSEEVKDGGAAFPHPNFEGYSEEHKRWIETGSDAGMTLRDWFWLIGYLAQKAATAHMAGDVFKAKHHTISTSAALANWHAAITGESTEMRPGIDTPEFARAALEGKGS